jgi:hypothetical protein
MSAMNKRDFHVIEGGARRPAGPAVHSDFKQPEHADVDETLRLLAGAEVPPGLAARIKNRLDPALAQAAAQAAEEPETSLRRSSSLIAWPREASAGEIWLRRAAAAAIFLAIGGGSWAVYTGANHALAMARKSTVPAVLSGRQQGDFGTAGALKKANPLMALLAQPPIAKKPAHGDSGAAQQ